MTDRSPARPMSVREAMDRVLAAEREAQGQIETCRSDAEQILSDARDRARRIKETTQRRISDVHAASHRQTAARIREMRREAAQLGAAIDYEPAQSKAVSEAAKHLARRLTSRHHDDL
ncbi:MAG: hypothetical protein JSW21_03585 [Gammaproteobacteria bacterium]|nr:MAG: hypothetical protein JSW21_03585 [Gammaproteobacteria bacterium]